MHPVLMERACKAFLMLILAEGRGLSSNKDLLKDVCDS